MIVEYAIAPRYVRSINLLHDFSDTAIGLAGYQVTPLVLQTLERVIAGVHSTARAFSLIGPYGAGKSAFGVFLAHYLHRTPAERLALLRTHATTDASMTLPDDTPVLHPVLIGGNQRSLRHAILDRLAQSMEDTGLSRFHVELDADIQRARTNPEVDPVLVATLLERSSVAVAAAGSADGMVLIIDELGQYLNYVVRHRDERDLFVLQSIAEMAARSGATPCIIITILHQAFDLYTGTAGRAQRTEWAKVQGRFTELPFQEPASQMMHMVGHALAGGDLAPDDPRWTWAERLAPVADELGLRPPDIDSALWTAVVARAYPLHPTVLASLPQLFRQLAQNERSLFAFLTSHEPWSLHDVLRDSSRPDLVYRMSHLYAYVEANLGASLFGRARGQRWAELAEARATLPDVTPVVQDTLTTIGTLGALGQRRDVKASREHIAFAVGDDPTDSDVTAAIEMLSAHQQIVYRKYRGSYVLFEGSDLDLDGLVQAARRDLRGRMALVDLLHHYADAVPLVARRTSYRTGTTRHFAVRFVDTADLNQSSALLSQSGR